VLVPVPALRGLLPPPPPALTHEPVLAALPAFPAGTASDRLARAKDFLQRGREQGRAFHQVGAPGVSTCRVLTGLTDRLVSALFTEVAEGRIDGICLVALGGYGRQELSPHSDVDLLLLRAGARADPVRALAQAFHTLLWDLRLHVGWSVRTPDECARAAADDHTVRTALLDARLVGGDLEAFESLSETLRAIASRDVDAFVANKTDELRARRLKLGDSVFVLEPNLKAGEGGLRDLETALWLAEARFGVRGLAGLERRSLLPSSEVAVLRSAHDFLLRSRHQLHYLRARKEDRLTFDLQEEVAAFLGYAPSDEGLPVEQYMRHYYLSANAIRRAADELVSRCEEHVARGSLLPDRRIGPFRVYRGKLAVIDDPDLFRRDPASVLRLFRIADEEGLPLHSGTRDRVVETLGALEEARGDPKVVSELRGLLTRPQTRGDFLREMHDLGVLGAVLPEFGRITAKHQHDLYHVYTVDVHSLFAVQRLHALEAGAYVAELPELSRVMEQLDDPLPLYLGMLFHDAGKGLGGDHSEKGRALMAAVGERLGLSARQREIAEFLVLAHLRMSHTAQRRDLSDPRLIAEFAREVGDLEKLACLYLLTWADIASVGPKMWTEWKGQLLHELYEKTRASLLGNDLTGVLAERKAPFEQAWSRAFGPERAQALVQASSERYFLTADPKRATLHARLLRHGRRGLATMLLPRREDTSELILCAPDREGLLALFAGVLSAHRIDILSARIESTQDGLALDTFEVHGPQGRLDRARWRTARADLRRVLAGELTVEELLRKRRGSALLQKALPKISTRVAVDNRASERFTVVDVRAEDRTGLLYAIASALKDAHAAIALAKVATEGHCARDAFYVTRAGEKLLAPEEVQALIDRVHRAVDRFLTT
jgi:[protein-PII] uridylyltransferase